MKALFIGIVLASLSVMAQAGTGAEDKRLHAEYAIDRKSIIEALDQVVANNAWHFDKRDDEHGDFRISIPKSPMWQGRLIVYLSSIDATHQQLTAYREKSGSVAAKKPAAKLFDGIKQILDSRAQNK
jgi:hypothetical protein